MIEVQNVILEMIAKGEPLAATIERLCLGGGGRSQDFRFGPFGAGKYASYARGAFARRSLFGGNRKYGNRPACRVLWHRSLLRAFSCCHRFLLGSGKPA
jgi:hypothetical protein